MRTQESFDGDAVIDQMITGQHPHTFAEIQISDGSRLHDECFQVDTASDVSTMTGTLYRQKYNSLPLEDTQAPIRNVSRQKIQGILGVIKTAVTIFGRMQEGRIHIMPDGHSNLLGLNFLSSLDIIVDCERRTVIDGMLWRHDGQIQDQTTTTTKTTTWEEENPRTSRTETDQTTAAPPGQQALPDEGGATTIKSNVPRKGRRKKTNA